MVITNFFYLISMQLLLESTYPKRKFLSTYVMFYTGYNLLYLFHVQLCTVFTWILLEFNLYVK